MLAPPHSLHLLLMRWCWQMLAPPHSLHLLLMRWCWQRPHDLRHTEPPQCVECLQVVFSNWGAQKHLLVNIILNRSACLSSSCPREHPLYQDHCKHKVCCSLLFKTDNHYVQADKHEYGFQKKNVHCGHA